MKDVVLPCIPLGGKHGPWRSESLAVIGKQLRELAAQTTGAPLNAELFEIISTHWGLFMASVQNVRDKPEVLRSLNGTVSGYARKALAEAETFRLRVEASGDKVILYDGVEIKPVILEMARSIEELAKHLIAQAEGSPG